MFERDSWQYVYSIDKRVFDKVTPEILVQLEVETSVLIPSRQSYPKIKKEVYKLKKGKITLVGAVVILITATFLFINYSSSKGKVAEVQLTGSSEIQAANDNLLEEMENFLYGDNGLMKQVGTELLENGYEVHIMIAAYSQGDIQTKIILTDREATESEQEKVKSIFYKLVEKNNLDSNAFFLKVADSDDGHDW